jgi:hypothetical protein
LLSDQRPPNTDANQDQQGRTDGLVMDFHCQTHDSANGFWKMFTLEQAMADPET